MLLANLLAIAWEPEFRGIVVVLIGFFTMCGGIYLLLGTNLGARLGLLVSLAGLMGWMFAMGIIWMIYGIGLTGAAPSWTPVQTVIGTENLGTTGIDILNTDILNATETAKSNGWQRLPDSDPGRGQAVASADEILQIETQLLKSGDYLPVAVYDKNDGRWPNFTIHDVKMFGRWDFGTWNFDYLAFFHRPHHALVQVKPVVPQNLEAGKAPPTPKTDPNAPDYFVLMSRDAGSKRHPAMWITLGSGIIFWLLCRALHRRDSTVAANRSAALEPAAAS